MNYKSGALLSPKDKRDWQISMCMDMPSGSGKEVYPDEYTVSWFPEKMKNQLQVNSCTSFATALIFECIYHKITGNNHDFSIGYTYGNRRETEYKGEGQIMRDCPKALLKYGNVLSDIYECLEEVSPVIDSFEKNYDKYSEYAKKLISGYVRLRSEDEVKAFIYKYDVPVFANTRIKYINPLSKSEALHAMPIIGYTKRHFIFQNSWGQYKCPHPKIEYDKIIEKWGMIPMLEKNFTDVNNDRWSAKAIQAAANDGIIQGFPDNSFKPEEAMTREQAAALWERMKRYFEENYEKKVKL